MLVLEASAERIVSSSLTWRTKTLPYTRSIIGQVVCNEFNAWLAQGESVSFTRRGSAVRNRDQVPNIWGIDVMVAWDLCKVFARVRFSYPPPSFVRVSARESHAV